MGIFVNASSDGIDTFLILTTPAIRRTTLTVKLASVEKHIFTPPLIWLKFPKEKGVTLQFS